MRSCRDGVIPEGRILRRLLCLCAMALSVAVAALVDAAGGATSVTSSSGGDARWGFLVAIAVAVAAFAVGGACIVVRSRREYLATEARKTERPPDGVDD